MNQICEVTTAMHALDELKTWEQRDPEATVIEGWDRDGFVIAALLIAMIWVPVVLVVTTWAWRLVFTAVAAAGAIAAATLRFRLVVSTEGVVLRRTCLGIPWRRRALPRDVRVSLYEPMDGPAEGVMSSKDENDNGGLLIGSRRNCVQLLELVASAIARRARR